MTKQYFESSDDYATALINLYKQRIMEKLKHGDDICVDIIDHDDDQFYTVYGKLCIDKEDKNVCQVYICHNDDRYDGAPASEYFGYQYSWYFNISKETGQPFSDESVKNLKKIGPPRKVKVDGVEFTHGDLVVATIHNKNVEGKLCINRNQSDTYLFVCQNEMDGNPNADECFGYKYGWAFSINNHGRLTPSSSLKKIVHAVTKVEHSIPVDYDDDPMPADWVCEEKIPDDL